MISLIICTRTTGISTYLQHNINTTIGLPYELVLIDNSDNKHTIFSAYNEGVKKSKFDYLCFMHDDIAYHTPNWGQLMLNHFHDEQTGAIGISGTPYVPAMPGAWWDGGLVNINIVPCDGEVDDPYVLSFPPATSNKNQVAVVDGVWFCIRKSLFKHIRFDEVNYTGFHYYDTDISLQVQQLGYKVYSVFDILIQHFSKGDMNANWYTNAIIFTDKWRAILPVTVGNISYKKKCEAELSTLKEFTFVLFRNKVAPKIIYTIAFNQLRKFYRGYFYHKVPVQLSKYLMRMITG